jgi:hypothetical protein
MMSQHPGSESVTWYVLQDLEPQITLTIDIAEDQSAAAHMKDCNSAIVDFKGIRDEGLDHQLGHYL